MVKLIKSSRDNYYYNICGLSESEMKEFLNKSRKNWKRAVQKSKISEYMGDMIVNEKVRGKLADFMKSELKLDRNTNVLDIGAGMGALTLALARKFKTTAIDANFLSLKFVKQRAEQEKVKLNLCHTSPLHKGLHFKNKSFDVVVMNGVLEWVAVGFPDIGRVENVQIKVLKEVYRILEKKGILILAIENRLAPLWFMGKTSHIPIKYIDLMPRKIADFICKRKTGEKFRAYLYSKIGYRNLLKKAGFKGIQFYEVYPNYQKPKWIKRTRNFFANSFVIVARKE